MKWITTTFGEFNTPLVILISGRFFSPNDSGMNDGQEQELDFQAGQQLTEGSATQSGEVRQDQDRLGKDLLG